MPKRERAMNSDNELKTSKAEISLPREAENIIESLEKGGFKAYAVGGAVRDCVSGLTPDDWDITTSARPEEIKKVFSKRETIETGIKHGTVTVLIDHKPYEVTSFRSEGSYSDCRHPDKVEFVTELSEDLRRRDFTVNSLAYNKKDGLIDLYGGLSDIDNKIIRTVGKAEERFSEDALRILRAVRFSSKLGFRIEPETKNAAEKLKGLLSGISAERIFSELSKTLSGKNAVNALLDNSGIICEIIPEMKPCAGFNQHSKWHKYDVYEHIVRSVGAIDSKPELKWAMFLHDIGKPEKFFMKDGEGHFYGHADLSAKIAERILLRLKASNSLRERVVFLVKNHDRPFPESEVKIKKMLRDFGAECFFSLVEVKKADNAAQGTDIALAESEKTENTKKTAEKIIESGECFSLKQMKISGKELSDIGFKGKSVGEELEKLLDMCIVSPELNDENKLVGLAEKHMEKINKSSYKSINEGF